MLPITLSYFLIALITFWDTLCEQTTQSILIGTKRFSTLTSDAADGSSEPTQAGLRYFQITSLLESGNLYA